MKNWKQFLKTDKVIYVIVIFFFIFNVFIGLHLSYINESYVDNDLFFDADISRAYSDYAIKDANHYRTSVHPLFVLTVQPIIILLNKIFHQPILAIILFQSILGALSIAFLFKTLSCLKMQTLSKIILSLIYGFSFSSIIFIGVPETYSVAAFFLILMWYVVVKLTRQEKPLTLVNYVCLILLGILSMAITITNILTYIIAMIYLLLMKNKSKSLTSCFLKSLTQLVIMISFSFLIAGCLATIQQKIWPSSTNFYQYLLDFSQNEKNEENNYINKNIKLENIKKTSLNFFAKNLISSRLTMIKSANRDMLYHCKINFIQIVAMSVLLCALAFSVIPLFRKKTIFNDRMLILAIGLSLLSYFGLHTFYGNDTVFLYSQHYTFLVILFLGLAFNGLTEKTRKILNIALIGYLIVEIYSNAFATLEIKKYLYQLYSTKNIDWLNKWIFISLVGFFIFSFILIINNILKKKIKNLI